jgi:hypothetical protein
MAQAGVARIFFATSSNTLRFRRIKNAGNGNRPTNKHENLIFAFAF